MPPVTSPTKDLLYPTVIGILLVALIVGMIALYGLAVGLAFVGWLFSCVVLYAAIRSRKMPLIPQQRYFLFGMLLIALGPVAVSFTQMFYIPLTDVAKEHDRLLDLQMLRDFYLVLSAGVGGNAVVQSIAPREDT